MLTGSISKVPRRPLQAGNLERYIKRSRPIRHFPHADRLLTLGTVVVLTDKLLEEVKWKRDDTVSFAAAFDEVKPSAPIVPANAAANVR